MAAIADADDLLRVLRVLSASKASYMSSPRSVASLFTAFVPLSISAS